MRRERFRRRLPAIASSVGLIWVLTVAAPDLDRPLVGFGLAIVLVLASLIWAKPEVVGVSIAAALALSALSTSTPSFVIAGVSAVLTLALLAFAERRFRTAAIGAAAAAVVVIVIIGPFLVEPPSPSVSFDDDNAPLVAADIRVVSEPAFPESVVISDFYRSGRVEEAQMVREMLSSERALYEQQSTSSIWDTLKWLLIAGGVLYLVKRSIADVQPERPTDVADQDQFVVALESAGKKAGVVRKDGESLLAFGDRVSVATGDKAFSRAASMTSERLYGPAGQVDDDALRSLLSDLARAPDSTDN